MITVESKIAVLQVYIHVMKKQQVDISYPVNNHERLLLDRAYAIANRFLVDNMEQQSQGFKVYTTWAT